MLIFFKKALQVLSVSHKILRYVSSDRFLLHEYAHKGTNLDPPAISISKSERNSCNIPDNKQSRKAFARTSPNLVPNFDSGPQERCSPGSFHRGPQCRDFFFRVRDISTSLHQALRSEKYQKRGEMVLKALKEQAHLA